MSGAEILGLAASVIQIADLGGRLSVKIFTFTRKVKNANKTIDGLSQEIAVTGAVLQQLGATLSNDASVKVCSQEAIDTARKLVTDTEKVFKKLEELLDTDEKSNSKFRKAINLKRLKFPFLESEIEQVQANLERLKSSLLVILNVLIFAEQLRNRETLPVLEDQRDLIRALAAEKDANEQRYDRILKAIADLPKIDVDDANKRINASGDNFDVNSINSATLTLVNASDNASQHSATSGPPSLRRVKDVPVVDLPNGLKHHHEEIHNHTQLVQNLLTEIDCLEYKLDHSVRGRLQTRILDVHWKEWDKQRRLFGVEPLQKIFAISPAVETFWTKRGYIQPTSSKRESRSDFRHKESHDLGVVSQNNPLEKLSDDVPGALHGTRTASQNIGRSNRRAEDADPPPTEQKVLSQKEAWIRFQSSLGNSERQSNIENRTGRIAKGDVFRGRPIPEELQDAQRAKNLVDEVAWIRGSESEDDLALNQNSARAQLPQFNVDHHMSHLSSTISEARREEAIRHDRARSLQSDGMRLVDRQINQGTFQAQSNSHSSIYHIQRTQSLASPSPVPVSDTQPHFDTPTSPSHLVPAPRSGLRRSRPFQTPPPAETSSPMHNTQNPFAKEGQASEKDNEPKDSWKAAWGSQNSSTEPKFQPNPTLSGLSGGPFGTQVSQSSTNQEEPQKSELPDLDSHSRVNPLADGKPSHEDKPEVDSVNELLLKYTTMTYKEIEDLWWSEDPKVLVLPKGRDINDFSVSDGISIGG